VPAISLQIALSATILIIEVNEFVASFLSSETSVTRSVSRPSADDSLTSLEGSESSAGTGAGADSTKSLPEESDEKAAATAARQSRPLGVLSSCWRWAWSALRCDCMPATWRRKKPSAAAEGGAVAAGSKRRQAWAKHRDMLLHRAKRLHRLWVGSYRMFRERGGPITLLSTSFAIISCVWLLVGCPLNAAACDVQGGVLRDEHSELLGGESILLLQGAIGPVHERGSLRVMLATAAFFGWTSLGARARLHPPLPFPHTDTLAVCQHPLRNEATVVSPPSLSPCAPHSLDGAHIMHLTSLVCLWQSWRCISRTSRRRPSSMW